MTIEAIPESDKTILWHDLQEYIGELSVFDPSVRVVDGVYGYSYFDDYWRDNDRYPFWLRVGGQIAGFALLRRTQEGPMEMAEFYVRPAFRRTGVGLECARELIARFSGHWIISQYSASKGAVAFWHKVIVDRNFNERHYVSENGNPRNEQRFIV